ncbi:hypothetical protein CTI12_AA371170 [Artemisia annua]|uniref:Helitron helicase-like domain-containing protein n=1 Tax=Artemisia annua TaxID=35608 RepID=A0A2U1MK62_ARTAN|nr:hypothetical protein CTI12_AA371170 [Artemisia annua]
MKTKSKAVRRTTNEQPLEDEPSLSVDADVDLAHPLLPPSRVTVGDTHNNETLPATSLDLDGSLNRNLHVSQRLNDSMDVVGMRRRQSSGVTINEPDPLYMRAAGRHQQSLSIDLVGVTGKRKLDEMPMSTGSSTVDGGFSNSLRCNEGVIAAEIDVPSSSYSTVPTYPPVSVSGTGGPAFCTDDCPGNTTDLRQSTATAPGVCAAPTVINKDVHGSSSDHQRLPNIARQRRYRVTSGSGTRARATRGPPDSYVSLGPCDRVCRHCNALFWFQERVKHASSRVPEYHRCCMGGKNEVRNRLLHFRDGGPALRPDIVEGLIQVLDELNELVRLFRTARDKLAEAEVPEFKIRLFGVLGSRQYELPSGDSIGAIVYEGEVLQMLQAPGHIYSSNDHAIPRGNDGGATELLYPPDASRKSSDNGVPSKRIGVMDELRRWRSVWALTCLS